MARVDKWSLAAAMGILGLFLHWIGCDVGFRQGWRACGAGSPPVSTVVSVPNGTYCVTFRQNSDNLWEMVDSGKPCEAKK